MCFFSEMEEDLEPVHVVYKIAPKYIIPESEIYEKWGFDPDTLGRYVQMGLVNQEKHNDDIWYPVTDLKAMLFDLDS